MHSTSREIAEIDLATGINSGGSRGSSFGLNEPPFLKKLDIT